MYVLSLIMLLFSIVIEEIEEDKVNKSKRYCRLHCIVHNWQTISSDIHALNLTKESGEEKDEKNHMIDAD